MLSFFFAIKKEKINQLDLLTKFVTSVSFCFKGIGDLRIEMDYRALSFMIIYKFILFLR